MIGEQMARTHARAARSADARYTVAHMPRSTQPTSTASSGSCSSSSSTATSFSAIPGKGERRLFGGLVAAQSVVAAYRTVEEGALHSLHAYFLRPGKHGVPIRYVVYRIRDGRSFTTRDVVAYQSARRSST